MGNRGMVNESTSGESWDDGGNGPEDWPIWWWQAMDLASPRLPEYIRGRLRMNSQADVWSTTDRYPAITVYGPFNLSDEFGKDVESNVVEEFFMTGIAGHGINSWGLGIVASFDAYIVATQVHFGGAFPSSYYRQQAIHMIGAWDTFVSTAEAMRAAFPAKRPKQPRWLIRFSDFRDEAMLLERDDDCRPEWGLAGWRPVFDAKMVGRSDPDLAGDTKWPEERALAVGLLSTLEELHERARLAPRRDDSSSA
jgi:hypothetical protein